MIDVDANLFRLAYTCISTEETRYYLNGVCIEPHADGGALMVSTDGHRLVAFYDKDAKCDATAIIRLPKFMLPLCFTPPKITVPIKRRLVVDTEANAATLNDITKKINGDEKVEPLATAYKVVIDGTFPDWRRVLPKDDAIKGDATMPIINPKYMKAWGVIGEQVAKVLGGNGAVSFAITTDSGPIPVRFDGREEVFGVQMPMRGSGFRSRLPTFAAPAAFKEAAE